MADSLGWTLRPAAEEDLRDIWSQTEERWGRGQAERYIDGLFATFALLAEHPQMARERLDFRPPVRIHPSGRHLIIYHLPEGFPEIIRILHMRQDWMRLLDRS